VKARRSLLRLTLKAAVSTALLAVVFAFVPFGAVLDGLRRLDVGYVAAGIALSPVALYLGALRTGILARRQGLTLTVGQIFRIGYIVQFYGLFLPGVIAGGAIRWYKFARQDGKPVAALTTIVAGRASSLFFGVAIGLLAWALDPVARRDTTFGIGLVVALLALGGAFWLLQHPAAAERAVRLVAASHRLPEKWRRAAASALDSRRTLRGFGGAVPPLLVVGTLEQAAAIVSDLLLAWAAGLDLGVLAVAWVRGYQLLIALLPITLGSLGVREGGMIVLLAGYGVSPESAVTYSLLLFGRRLFSALIGSAIELAGFLLPGVAASRAARDDDISDAVSRIRDGR
jgi:uncharacterized protein (TIRG00374 family)